MTKTNAMRLLDKAGICYQTVQYEYDEKDLSGIHVAEEIGLPSEQVYKTLVTRNEENGLFVFCIPVYRELNLKKAASISDNKRLDMVHVKELLSLTGYIRGGCSPIGMKKKFPTCIHSDALHYDIIAVSAGIRGLQLLLNPRELISFTSAVAENVVKE